MKRLVSSLLCLLLLLAVCPTAVFAASGVTYYVSSEGSDDNSGTSVSSPFRTPERLNSVTLRPGDSVLFRRGDTFGAGLRPAGGGSADEPVLISSYGEGSLPVFCAGKGETALTLEDFSYVTVRGLEITSPEGNPIKVYFSQTTVTGVRLEELKIHDVLNTPATSNTWVTNAPIIISSDPAGAVDGASFKDIYVTGCEIWNSSWGIYESSGSVSDTAQHPYSRNVVIDSCYIHDLLDDGCIVTGTDGLRFTNDTVLNCCQSDSLRYGAPTWMAFCTNALYEKCEIGGAANNMDGMAIDFDENCSDCTAQYIYSHDNTRFVWMVEHGSENFGNTVRCCLSVNDDRGESGASYAGGISTGYRFYNNTIIGGANMNFTLFPGAQIKNNIFELDAGRTVILKSGNGYDIGGNCYYDTIKPAGDSGSLSADPQFTGGNTYDKNSYILKKCSPLIGAGKTVSGTAAEYDFYGNPFSGSLNVGCYAGTGVDGAKNAYSFEHTLKLFLSYIRYIYAALIHDINWLLKKL